MRSGLVHKSAARSQYRACKWARAALGCRRREKAGGGERRREAVRGGGRKVGEGGRKVGEGGRQSGRRREEVGRWEKVGEGGRRWEKVGEGGRRWEKEWEKAGDDGEMMGRITHRLRCLSVGHRVSHRLTPARGELGGGGGAGGAGLERGCDAKGSEGKRREAKERGVVSQGRGRPWTWEIWGDHTPGSMSGKARSVSRS